MIVGVLAFHSHWKATSGPNVCMPALLEHTRNPPVLSYASRRLYMSDLTRLPIEVLESIVDVLAAESKNTLKVLSLTSKLMVPLCHRLLFSTFNYESGQFLRLTALLQQPTDIFSYVNIFEYAVDMAKTTEHDYAIMEALYSHSHSSSRLRTIHIYATGGFDWTLMHEKTNVHFTHLLRLPTVTSLHMTSIFNFPMAVLSHCSYLNDLNLNNVTPSTLDSNMGLEKPTFTALSIDGSCGQLLHACMRPLGRMEVGPILDFSGLQYLSVTLETLSEEGYMVDLMNLLRYLRHLRLLVHSPICLVELAATSALRTIDSFGCVIRVMQDGYDPLRGLNILLNRMARNNVLRELFVTITVDQDVSIRTDCDDWSDFDMALGTSGAFPALEYVNLELWWHSYNREDNEVDAILGKVSRLRFPKLVESATTQFNFSEVHKHYG